MEEVCCGVCLKRISNWMMAGGKTIVINGQMYHTACLQDKTIAEVAKA